LRVVVLGTEEVALSIPCMEKEEGGGGRREERHHPQVP